MIKPWIAVAAFIAAATTSSQTCTYGDPPLAFKQQIRSFGTFRTLLSVNFYF